MQIIPLSATPSQIVTCVLNGQNVQVSLYQKTTGMFIDCALNGVVIFSCFQVMTGVNLIQQSYYGFIGGLVMFDTQGTENPSYQGLGTRWVLGYLLPNEVPQWRG